MSEKMCWNIIIISMLVSAGCLILTGLIVYMNGGVVCV